MYFCKKERTIIVVLISAVISFSVFVLFASYSPVFSLFLPFFCFIPFFLFTFFSCLLALYFIYSYLLSFLSPILPFFTYLSIFVPERCSAVTYCYESLAIHHLIELHCGKESGSSYQFTVKQQTETGLKFLHVFMLLGR